MWRTIDRSRRVSLLTGLALTAALTGCGSSSGGGGDNSAFCGVLKEQLPAYTAAPLKALAPDAGASAWKAHFDDSHRRAQKMIDGAPAEMRTAATNLQAANDRLAAFLAEAEYDPGKIDDGALAQLLHDSGYTDAVTTITGYAKNTCKLDVPASAG